MNNYLVGIKFIDTDIDVQMVTANSWKEALYHSLLNICKEGQRQDPSEEKMEKTPEEWAAEAVNYLPDDLEEAKDKASKHGWEFHVREIHI